MVTIEFRSCNDSILIDPTLLEILKLSMLEIQFCCVQQLSTQTCNWKDRQIGYNILYSVCI